MLAVVCVGQVSDMQQRKPKTVTVPLELESRALVGHRKAVQCVAFHPAHDWLASGSDDGSIRVWDIDSGACLQVLQGHSRGIQSLAWAPSGKYLGRCPCCPISQVLIADLLINTASGSSDATAKLWHDDGDSLSCIKTLIGHDDSVTCTVFSKDSQTLFTGSKDESIRVWAVKTGICNQTLSHDDWVRCVDISPQHPFLASGYNNVLLPMFGWTDGSPRLTLMMFIKVN